LSIIFPRPRSTQIWSVDGIEDDLKSRQITTPEWTEKTHSSTVNFIARNPHSPDEIASGSDDGTVRLWSLENATTEHTFRMSRGDPGVRCVAYSPVDDLIASACADGVVRCFDARERSQNPVMQLRATNQALFAVDFASDGFRIVTGGEGDNVVAVDMRKAAEDQAVSNAQTQRLHSDAACRCLAVVGNWVVSSGNDKHLHVWELTGGVGHLTKAARKG
jgi:WD40 repeat protein